MDTILFITDLHVGSQVAELGGVFDRALAHRWRIVEVELTRVVHPISEIVRQWRPAGCILEGSGGPKVNLRRTFRGIPVVHLDPDPETAARAKHTVSGDPATIATWAARELMRASPASYAYVGWGTPAVWSTRRGQAFEEAVRRETGTKTAVFSERWDIGDTIGVQDGLVEFLMPLKKPVGIFAVNDYTAIQVAEACTKAGLKCPEDFMLVGVDNEEVHCECTVPTVTSIEQDFRGAGRMAADLLAELIADPALPPRHVKYGPVRLVHRQSTRTLKMHDPQIARAVERIRRDANTGLTSADVLAEIPVSRRLAEKRFLAATGHTILQEIQEVRFQKVCELLMGDIPIGHIAERCGLQSDSFLKRFFKARTGQTLREWRKAHKAPRSQFKMHALGALMLASAAVIPPESFVREQDGVFRCDLAGTEVAAKGGEIKSGGWAHAPKYPALYFGNEPQPLAREPDGDAWFEFEGEDNVRVPGLPNSGYSLAGYWTHDWAFEVLRVESVENGVAKFKDRHDFGIGKHSWGARRRRFYAVNHRQFLDSPGEWLLDGKSLLFIPPGGKIDAKQVTLAWGDDPVLLLEHRRNEAIRGRTIAFGGGAGLVLRDCHDVLVSDCTIECVAGSGIEIAGDCTGVVVSNCVVRNVGCCGVEMGGGNRRKLERGGNRVVDCEITRFGQVQRVYAPGVRLGGCGNEVVRCKIHHAPHSAILYHGNEHLIADNDIFDVVRETGDAGAIYSGRDWTSQGNVLARNRIHDLGQSVSNGKSHDVFTMGIYLDDCDCGDTLVSNEFVRAGCAVMIGGGRENRVIGNMIADCDIGIHLDDRGVTWTQHWNNPDDPSWNLVKKAEDLGYRDEPWRSRYPRLAATMDDEPRLPKYNVFDGNTVTRCRIPYQFNVRDAVWSHAETFRSQATGLFYGAGKDETEDCTLLSAMALSALVDMHSKDRANDVAKALLRLCGAAGVPGHVCKGMSRDGRTVNKGSSRDQITLFVHGLYRHYTSGMPDDATKAAIGGAFASIADRMLQNVSEANGWNALDADGKPDAAGVLKMWHVHPHEAARLPMVYLAAWKTTGDRRYLEAYEKIADEALDQSWGISRMTEAERRRIMPGHAFHQMNASLEVIRHADKARASKAEAVMKEVALLAARRFVSEQGADGQWLSAAGDLACAVSMASKIELVQKVLGTELYEEWERLANDCFLGLNGQTPPWEAMPARTFPLLSAQLRLIGQSHSSR